MYKQMLEQQSQLPVFQYKSTLIEAIKKNRVVVVKGATGCGKTTQVYKSYHCLMGLLARWEEMMMMMIQELSPGVHNIDILD